MSIYTQNKSIAMQPGKNQWTIGSVDDEQAPGLYQVTQVGIDNGVVSLVSTVREGNTPQNGDTDITVRDVPLIGSVDVNGDQDITYVLDILGLGMVVQFNAALADVPLTPSSGGWIENFVHAVPEAVPVGSASAYQQVTWPNDPHIEGGFPTHLHCALAWYVTPTAAVAKLQQATTDTDGSYADVATISSVAAGVITDNPQVIALVPGKFYRIKITGTSGAQGKAFAGFTVDYN